MTQAPGAADAAHTELDTGVTLNGLAIALDPDAVMLNLLPRPAEADPSALWHPVCRPPAALLTITSRAARPRLVHLTVQGVTDGWRPEWTRWAGAARIAPEHAGGEAVTAHDSLSGDQRQLTLMVLPGEVREAALEFHAWLEPETLPGHYPFAVTIVDATDGDGDAAEIPGALWIQHPPPRYLEMLPALYRDAMARERDSIFGDSQPPFFERFLRGFEDARQPLLDTIADLDHLFAAFRTPSDFVPWLATWVALALDENWPEMKRRRLIREAMELYRWRGTRKGLARYLEIYTGVTPDINDQPFDGMRLGKDALLGRHTVLGDVRPHCFVVTLAVPDGAPVREHIVRAIIESEMPAHTAYDLRIVRRRSPEMRAADQMLQTD